MGAHLHQHQVQSAHGKISPGKAWLFHVLSLSSTNCLCFASDSQGAFGVGGGLFTRAAGRRIGGERCRSRPWGVSAQPKVAKPPLAHLWRSRGLYAEVTEMCSISPVVSPKEGKAGRMREWGRNRRS